VAPARARATLEALAAAALFGVSPAMTKALGLEKAPLVGSGVLYGGAGAALALALGVRALLGERAREAALGRADVPLVLAVVAVGGLVAPVLLLGGLDLTSGSVASLLLNLEVPFTAGLAVLLFRERLGAAGWLAIAMLAAAAAWLGHAPAEGEPRRALALGALLVAGASLCWALDNNLTRRLSSRDPFAVVACKGLGAGAVALALARIVGQPFPAPRVFLLGLGLGALSYGVSLVLFVRALRHLGAARTTALFATAPFVGAAAALAVLRERASASLLGAGLLMAAGVALLLRDRAHVAAERTAGAEARS
jgi:drug/metabolite transporter (DMT)-like permease